MFWGLFGAPASSDQGIEGFRVLWVPVPSLSGEVPRIVECGNSK